MWLPFQSITEIISLLIEETYYGINTIIPSHIKRRAKSSSLLGVVGVALVHPWGLPTHSLLGLGQEILLIMIIVIYQHQLKKSLWLVLPDVMGHYLAKNGIGFLKKEWHNILFLNVPNVCLCCYSILHVNNGYFMLSHNSTPYIDRAIASVVFFFSEYMSWLSVSHFLLKQRTCMDV